MKFIWKKIKIVFYLIMFAAFAVALSVFIFLNQTSIKSFFKSEITGSATTTNSNTSDLLTLIDKNNLVPITKLESSSTAVNVPQQKLRILIIPGHEPNFGGAEFGNLKERTMNVELGNDLKQNLDSDSNFQTFITRGTKSWTPDFSKYFTNNRSDILKWIKTSREAFFKLIATGSTTKPYSEVIHNTAPPEVAIRLFGMTKWANEHNIDVTINIHFNDDARSNYLKAGKYSGFAIYVPVSQYRNSATTKLIADRIFNRLSQKYPVSNLKQESGGIINEADLIAVGVNNTSDAASILIEYGYIYEKQFQNSKTRSAVIKDFALQTYLGLKDYFDLNSEAVPN
ncbi:MAG: N-acetylmuramoyl-L-alanine amidase [bacterium]